MSDVRELPANVVRTKDVIGNAVKNEVNESLGKIEELALDKITGEVRYAVLSFGGFLGMGDKLFALPWKKLHYNNDKECYILNVDKDKLKNAPGFDKNNWPNMADQGWGEGIYNYYGADWK